MEPRFQKYINGTKVMAPIVFAQRIRSCMNRLNSADTFYGLFYKLLADPSGFFREIKFEKSSLPSLVYNLTLASPFDDISLKYCLMTRCSVLELRK